MQFQTPILFLVFNRPEQTCAVFEEIRRQRPAKFYVAADGPRAEKRGEWRLCAETRKFLERIDWDCETKTLLREENLGCGRAVSEAISWFFDQEEEGIILEDDCLPDASFFPFCSEMLERFRHDEKIGSISGDNFFPSSFCPAQPYLFSKYVQVWGWATWRRFWQHYDFRLSSSNQEWEEVIRRVNPIENQARYWLEICQAMKSDLLDTWDYQVMFSSWKADCWHIYPNRNLIVNLGYGPDATHTHFESPLAGMQRLQIENYRVTLRPEVDPALDNAIFYFRFLESLTNVWWLQQAFDPTKQLGWLRWKNERAQNELRRFKTLHKRQSRELAKILSARLRESYQVKWVLLLNHLIFTLRETLGLLRGKLNLIIGRTLLRKSPGKLLPGPIDKNPQPVGDVAPKVVRGNRASE